MDNDVTGLKLGSSIIGIRPPSSYTGDTDYRTMPTPLARLQIIGTCPTNNTIMPVMIRIVKFYVNHSIFTYDIKLHSIFAYDINLHIPL